MDSKPQTRNAIRTNSFLPESRPVSLETATPRASGTTQASVETKMSPKNRRVEAIDLWSKNLIVTAKSKPATGGKAVPQATVDRGNRLTSETSSIRTALEMRTRGSEIARDGRTNRFLYLFASWSVDAPYSWTYLKNRFSSMEMNTRDMEAAKTN